MQPDKGNFPLVARPGLRKVRILVAPLDWGLGHATRCIPIINELLARNCEVWLAGEGAQQELLTEQFPGIPFLQLPGYRVRYGRSSNAMLWTLLGQSAKIIRAIRDEHRWLKKKVKELSFDAVISDNRYGLYHKEIPCIFITHQLAIRTPLGKWPGRLLQRKNYKYINRFNECWVPDAEGENNLAGDLSHPLLRPSTVLRYTGPLSRIDKSAGTISQTSKDHLFIILSGPEPTRTILEKLIIRDIQSYKGTATIVRGLPGSEVQLPSNDRIQYLNHITAAKLTEEMHRASFIICRSGYSSIMDITALGKRSILIPTPGQTEQEYLASYLDDKRIAMSISQKQFSLLPALQQARSFAYDMSMIPHDNSLSEIITNFLETVHAHSRH